MLWFAEELPISRAKILFERFGRPTLVDIPGNFRRVGHVEVFQFLDFKPGLRDQIRNMPIQMTASSQFAPTRGDTMLPGTGTALRGLSMLQKEQIATRLQHALHL